MKSISDRTILKVQLGLIVTIGIAMAKLVWLTAVMDTKLDILWADRVVQRPLAANTVRSP